MNRARFERMAEILELGKKGASITAFLSSCGLNWNHAKLITRLLETH